jgi:ribosomal protein S2
MLLKILYNSLSNLIFTLFVLFVGTKPQFSAIIKSCALSCKSYYVTERWLGGMLTNWSTIKLCIKKLDIFCD